MSKFQRFVIWVLIIAALVSASSEPLRHVILPNDATATDSEIVSIILLSFVWIVDVVEGRE